MSEGLTYPSDQRRHDGLSSGVVAGCFALASFCVAILAGLIGGNPASSVLFRAIIAMMLCYPVGLVIGMICQRVINEHVHRMEQAESAPAAETAPEAPVTARGAADSSVEEEEPIVV